MGTKKIAIVCDFDGTLVKVDSLKEASSSSAKFCGFVALAGLIFNFDVVKLVNISAWLGILVIQLHSYITINSALRAPASLNASSIATKSDDVAPTALIESTMSLNETP